MSGSPLTQDVVVIKNPGESELAMVVSTCQKPAAPLPDTDNGRFS